MCQQVHPNELLAFAQNSQEPDPTIAPIGTAWSIESKVALIGALVVAIVTIGALMWFARRRHAATTG